MGIYAALQCYRNDELLCMLRPVSVTNTYVMTLTLSKRLLIHL